MSDSKAADVIYCNEREASWKDRMCNGYRRAEMLFDNDTDLISYGLLMEVILTVTWQKTIPSHFVATVWGGPFSVWTW